MCIDTVCKFVARMRFATVVVVCLTGRCLSIFVSVTEMRLALLSSDNLSGNSAFSALVLLIGRLETLAPTFGMVTFVARAFNLKLAYFG